MIVAFWALGDKGLHVFYGRFVLVLRAENQSLKDETAELQEENRDMQLQPATQTQLTRRL